MQCRNCGMQMSEEAEYCGQCGAKVVKKTTCKHCGTIIEGDSQYCYKCGLRTWLPVSRNASTPIQQSASDCQSSKSYTYGSKAIATFWISVINAIISLLIRLTNQETFYYWSDLIENRKVVGLDKDMKPFVTILPIVATIIVSILFVKDAETGKEKKKIAIILNVVFITLSLLFIWFDIPYNLIDF